MDQIGILALTRSLTAAPSRRDVLRGLAGAGLGLGAARWPNRAAAKKGKPKPKSKKGLCAKDWAKCRKEGKNCKKTFCLRAPFTIEATWTQADNHDSYLFVPPQDATTGPAPHINQFCKPETSLCEEAYPFACFDGDEDASGAEVSTIHRPLPGTYEFWVELVATTPAGAVAVALEDGGRVVRRWTSPANASQGRRGWHVFDVDGKDGRVVSIDVLLDSALPGAAHTPSANVCPD